MHRDASERVLFCMGNRAGLADDRHADLARIFQIVLDLAGDIFAQFDNLQIVDLIRLHDHPDLAAGLNGECLVHAPQSCCQYPPEPSPV